MKVQLKDVPLDKEYSYKEMRQNPGVYRHKDATLTFRVLVVNEDVVLYIDENYIAPVKENAWGKEIFVKAASPLTITVSNE